MAYEKSAIKEDNYYILNAPAPDYNQSMNSEHKNKWSQQVTQEHNCDPSIKIMKKRRDAKLSQNYLLNEVTFLSIAVASFRNLPRLYAY